MRSGWGQKRCLPELGSLVATVTRPYPGKGRPGGQRGQNTLPRTLSLFQGSQRVLSLHQPVLPTLPLTSPVTEAMLGPRQLVGAHSILVME